MTTVLQYLVIAAVIGLLLFGLALLLFGRGERLSALPARTSPARLPERDIRGADVRQVRFALALRGYRMSDVDWTLERLADELDRTRQELALATGRDAEDERFTGDMTADDNAGGLTAGHRTVDEPTTNRLHDNSDHPTAVGRSSAMREDTSAHHRDAAEGTVYPGAESDADRSRVPVAGAGTSAGSPAEYRVDPGWSTAPAPVAPPTVTSAPNGFVVTGSSSDGVRAADGAARGSLPPAAVAGSPTGDGWAVGAAVSEPSTAVGRTNGSSAHGAATSEPLLPDLDTEPPGVAPGSHGTTGSDGTPVTGKVVGPHEHTPGGSAS